MVKTKIFADNPETKYIRDNFFISTKGASNDFKVSYETLLDTFEKDKLKKQFLRDVGKKFIINFNNNFKNQLSITDDYHEYLLLDGRQILAEDYPELANILGRKQSVLELPSMSGCAFKSVAQGSGRALGSFEEDAVASHNHGMAHDHDMTHNHYMAHQHNYQKTRTNGGNDWFPPNYSIGSATTYNTTGGRKDTGFSSISRTGESSFFAEDGLGVIETRMKNVAVQVYILAKFLG